MQEKTFRTFFAIDPPKEIKKDISRIIRLLSQDKRFKNIKWYSTKKLHITLCFLGNINQEQLEKIDEKIKKSIASWKKFGLKFKTIAPFPGLNNFIALAIKPEKSESLTELADEISQIATSCGIKLEKRKFKPHLTLGRAKYRIRAAEKFKVIFKFTPISFQVTEIKLYKSELKSTGSVYTEIADYPL